VLKNVTLTVEDKVLLWARRKAAEQNTSVSRLLSEALEREMKQDDSYWRAYESWKNLKPWPIKASERMSREEAHERRR
jgi:hypothetical protein